MSILRHLNSLATFVDSLESEAKATGAVREARINALEDYLFREKRALLDFIEKTFEDLIAQITSCAAFDKDDTGQAFANLVTLRGLLTGDVPVPPTFEEVLNADNQT